MEQTVIYRVQENPDYIKDQETGAVLNTNIAGLNEYRLKKQQSNKIHTLEEEIKELRALIRVVIERQQCQ
jgi:hypothetical protein